MGNVRVYTRTNNAAAWKYEHTCNEEAAELARDVNKGFGVDTLLVPDQFPAYEWLDSAQSQGDFPKLQSYLIVTETRVQHTFMFDAPSQEEALRLIAVGRVQGAVTDKSEKQVISIEESTGASMRAEAKHVETEQRKRARA